jgi:hypothetical protein
VVDLLTAPPPSASQRKRAARTHRTAKRTALSAAPAVDAGAEAEAEVEAEREVEREYAPMAVLQNHSAGRDAFCTGFLAARYSQQLGAAAMTEAANRVYVIGKAFPLRMERSQFAHV